MRLQKLSVKNFRTLEDVEVEFVGYYTAISGQNNAGKTSLIRAIRNTFRDNLRDDFFHRRREHVKHSDDATQWTNEKLDIVFEYQILVSQLDAPGLYQFIEKFNEELLKSENVTCKLRVSYSSEDESACHVWVEGKALSTFNRVLKKGPESGSTRAV